MVIGSAWAIGNDDGVETRVLRSAGDGIVTLESRLPAEDVVAGWVWVDVLADDADIGELTALTAGLRLDPLAMRDAVGDFDLPKVDDFGHHLLVVLHGLREDRVGTYKVDCFVTGHHLLTVRRLPSPALDALWNRVQASRELATGGVDELLARLADVLTRRLLSVLDAFDDRVDDLVDQALGAGAELVADLTAVRTDLSAVRRVVHPQREALDLLRHSTSPLISDAGLRRFSDVFDLASRAAHGLDAARTALAEILDAYRGAEARQATDVTKVLTIYAAIMLPLSLVAGFFGMNFANLPGLGSDWGWVVVTSAMLAIAAVSLGIFVSVGWIRRPSGREAGAALGRGLIEAARAPAQIVGAVYEIAAMPLRATTARRPKTPPDETT
jgi:magnesium transporter